MSEQETQRKILHWLSWLGLKAVKVPIGPQLVKVKTRAKNPLAGFPDIMGWLECGKPFYIEVKTETGVLSPKQKEWKSFFESTPGTIYILARSLGDVRTRLGQEIDPSPPQPA